MKKPSIKVLLFLFLLITTVGLFSCSQDKDADQEKQEQKQEQEARQKAGLKPGEVMLSQKQFDAVGIQLGSVEQKDLTDLVKANGFLTVAPQHKASISAFMGGVVKSIFVQIGDYVKKGQTLALLEHPDYIQLQDDYLKAKSNFTFLEKQFARQKELYAGNATAEKTLQQTEADYNSANAAFKSLESKLKLLNINLNKLENGEIVSAVPIISPINGYVQAVGVNLGKYADPMQEIFSVVDNSQMQVELQVYENDISKIKTGQKNYFTLPNTGQTLTNSIAGYAYVFSIGKALDNSTKSITVLAKVTGKTEKDFLPGIYVNGYIETGTQTTEAVPNEAIINEGQNNKVLVLLRTIKDAEGVEFIFGTKDVKAGISEAGFTAITFLDELPKDARIVTKGAFFIESEMNKKAEGEVD